MTCDLTSREIGMRPFSSATIPSNIAISLRTECSSKPPQFASYCLNLKGDSVLAQATTILALSPPDGYKAFLYDKHCRLYPHFYLSNEFSLEASLDAFKHYMSAKEITLKLLLEPEWPSFFVDVPIAPYLRPASFIEEPKPCALRYGGAFGQVTKVRVRATNGFLALKEIDGVGPRDEIRDLREAHLLISLNHPCVLRCEGVILDDSSQPRILTPWYPHGSLEMLLNAPHVALTPTQKQILIVGILIGMVYLRENRIRHRDVRPANVLVDEVGDSHYLLLHSFMR